MLKLTKFDKTDFNRYPNVEVLAGDIVPMLGQMKMRTPDYEGLSATVVVDGNGIQVMIDNEDGEQKMVFCRELNPFPLAVFVAEHLEEPLDPEVLIKLGFERFECMPDKGGRCWLPFPFG
ncbi:MAG: hypothetical protein ABSA04_01070 [Desulfobaccales bacterium]|jgi:hypothetical protein